MILTIISIWALYGQNIMRKALHARVDVRLTRERMRFLGGSCIIIRTGRDSAGKERF